LLLRFTLVETSCPFLRPVDNSLGPEGESRVEPLTDAVDIAEGRGKQLRLLLSKSREVLANLHAIMRPKVPAPKKLEELVDAFHSSDDIVKEFCYSQSERGSQSVLTMAIAHGAKADFQKITSTFPTGPDGQEVDLKPASKTARKYSKQLMKLISAREAEKEKSAAENLTVGAASTDADV